MKTRKLRIAVIAFLAFAVTTLAQTVPSYVPTNGLVGYWGFNGNANDLSGNGNNGTVNGATLTTDRNGNANSAYSFDGVSNYIEIPNSGSLQNISSITIGAWININQLYQSGGDGFFSILHKSNQQVIWGQYDFGIWSPNLIAHLNDQSTSVNFPLTLSAWQYVAVVINNYTSSFYLNGSLLWTGPTGSPGENSINNMPLLIGIDMPGLVEYANGKIDDISIYNRALTQAEITQLYTSTSSAQTLCTKTIQPYNVNVGDTTHDGSTYAWSISPATPSAVITGNGNNSIAIDWTNAPNGTYTIQAIETSIDGCVSTAVSASINLSGTPTAPVSPATQIFCTASTVANLAATGTNLQWYDVAKGGTALASTTALVTGTTYYASQTIGTCESTRTSVVVTITPTTAPTAVAQTFCTSVRVANLVATGTTIKWYSAATGGTALASTTALVTGTIYYASQTVGACESTRTAVAVTVTPATSPIAVAQTFCAASTVANLVATGENIKWYASANDIATLASSTVLSTGKYYATQTINGCGSARTEVIVSVNDAEIIASATNVCSGKGVELNINQQIISGPNYSLYHQAGGYLANPNNDDYVVFPVSPTLNTNYPSWTMECWAKIMSPAEEGILSLGNPEHGGGNIIGSGWSNTLAAGSNTDAGGSGTISSYNYPTAVWNHFALSYQSGTYRLFLNGVLKENWNSGSSVAINDLYPLMTNTHWWWRGGDLSSHRMTVYYDDIRVSKVCRYTSDFVPKTNWNNDTNTVGLWNFNEGSGNTVIDYSGNLNSGIIYGATYSSDVPESSVNNVKTSVTYLWSTAETTATINPTPTETTAYWCDVTNNGVTCRKEITITVTPKTIPTFTQVAAVCSGATIAALPTTLTNAVKGTWSPAINNTATTTYTFTPTAGLCANTAMMTIIINPKTMPTFTQVAAVCYGATIAALPTTSTNAVKGTWSPALNNLATTTYTFTPSVGLCANTATMTIIVNPKTIPTFTQVAAVCSGATIAVLPTTSTNAVTGTWSPAINNTATTTYTFTPTAGLCANTATMTIIVNPKTMPTFTQVAAVCYGATIAALPTTSTNAVKGTWSPALNNLATTTYTFTPSVGLCANTAMMTIIVNPKTIPTFTQVAAVCSGATIAVLPTTSTNAVTGTWSPAINNTATTTYTFTPTAGLCANTATMTITVNLITAAPTATASQTFCASPEPTIASLTTTGTAIQWYSAATGGTALASTTALVTGTTYYASQTIGTCESTRRSVAVTVTLATSPKAVAQTFCTSARVANLVATGTTIKWYSAATGGTALANTNALVTRTTYYASQTIGTCESTRTSVVVTITPTTAPTAVSQTFCTSARVANLVATGTTIKWYSAATGGTALANTTALVSGTTYYASQTVGACESTRTAVAVTVTLATSPTAVAQTFCTASTVANLVATGTAIKWYSAAIGGTALASTTALVTRTTYYASQTIGTCESTRKAVAVTVTPTTAPTAVAQTFCTSARVANLVAIGTAIKWYAIESGGTALASDVALVSGMYYVSQTINDCESTRVAVSVAVNVLAAPIAAAQTFYSLATVANLVATGTNIKWYTTPTDGAPLAPTTVLITGTYYASQTIDSCESTRTATLPTVTVQGSTPTAQTFFGNATIGDLAATGTVVKWYASSSTGTVLSDATLLVSGTTYYKTETLNGIESPRTAVLVTIYETVPPTASAQIFCDGATVASLVATGIGLKWYATATAGIALANTAPLKTGTYYVSQTLSGSESPRTAVPVTGNSLQIIASANTVCSGAAVSLSFLENSTTANYSLDFPNNSQYSGSAEAVCNSNLSGFDLTGNFTIEFWIKAEQSYYWHLMGKNSFGNNSQGWLLKKPGNDLMIGWTYVPNEFSFHTFNYNAWEHVAVSYDDESNTFYYFKNGNLISSENRNIIINPAPYNFVIGHELGTGNWFKGKIDNLRISNVVRYTDNFNPSQNFITDSNTIAMYDFNEGSGGIANDLSGNNRILSLFNTNYSSDSFIGNTSSSISYLWSTGETTSTINPRPSATTNFWCDVTTNGTTCRKEIIITVPPKAIPTFSTVASICAGSSLDALPTTSLNGYTGTWSPALNNLATTKYTFTPAAGECATTATMTIEVISYPAPTAAAQTFCGAPTVANLVATGDIIKWYASANETSVLASSTALATGTYYVTQTINGCESARTEVAVSVNNAEITASVNTVCSGTTVSLKVNSFNSPSNLSPTWELLIPSSKYNGNNLNFSETGYNRNENLIYSINGSYSVIFNLNSNSVNTSALSNIGSGPFTYDYTNNRLIYGRSGRDNLYAIPANGGNVSQIGTGSFDAESYGGRYFWNPTNQKTGLFGGYGYFAVKNWIWENNGAWTNPYVNSSNCNATTPAKRNGQFALGAPNSNKLYLFSGQGSCDGNQFASSCSLGSPWATDVGVYCWLKDLWELDLKTYTFKNILPVNSNSITKEGNFVYDYNANTFYIIGGYIPSATYNRNSGNVTDFETGILRYRVGVDSGFLPFDLLGTPPPVVKLNNLGASGTYYDATNNQIVWLRKDGVWGIKLSGGNQSTYFWSTGETTATINPTPTATTTYWCDITTNGVTCRKEFTITVTPKTTPTFTQVVAVCSGATIAALPTTSNNAVKGTWSPAINNTATTIYTFTPSAGLCATTAKMTITVMQQPIKPTVACYEIATFNTSTCTWDVTGTAIQAPVGAPLQTFVAGQTIADLMVSGTKIVWYATKIDATNQVSPLVSSRPLVDKSTYYATQAVNGCTSTTSLEVRVTVTESLTIAAFAKDKEFSIYPNPVSTILHLKHSNSVVFDKLVLIDISGKVILVQTQNTDQISVEKLADGIYFLKAFSGEEYFMSKFIKK